MKRPSYRPKYIQHCIPGWPQDDDRFSMFFFCRNWNWEIIMLGQPFENQFRYHTFPASNIKI
jgi:hypothetical protein